jgi:four helix bundle protein
MIASIMEDMVILVRTFDLLTWLLPQCEKFPKAQRFGVTQRLVDAALDFQEALFEANARSGRARLQHLQAADAHLNKLRLYLRLAFKWRWLTSGQHEHVSNMVVEIGRLLGGWIKQTRTSQG